MDKQPQQVPLSSIFRRFFRREEGAMTVFGLFMLVITLGIGGIALDFSNAMRLRSQMQVAIDAAAHAALVARHDPGTTEAEAIAAGLTVAEAMLPVERHGEVVRAEDFVFGVWDEVTRTFTPQANATDAVQLDARRTVERGNPLRTYLLRFLGPDDLDLARRTVADTYLPTCLREGFVGEQYVDVTSNSFYLAGFCIHSNGYVEMNNNNDFETGVIVSMPDRFDVVLPSAGMESNTGLAEALRDGYYDITAAERVNAMLNLLDDPYHVNYPTFITSPLPVSHPRNQPLDETEWQEGRIHTVDCPSSNQRVRIPNNTVLRNGVLITNCEIAFGSSAAVEDVVIVTTSDSVDSITGADSIRFGRDDNCAPGGGAEILTLGGVRVPSGLEMHGARIVAAQTVSFTADIGGLNGVSIISDEAVEGTANGSVGLCGIDGLPSYLDPVFFRIVQ